MTRRGAALGAVVTGRRSAVTHLGGRSVHRRTRCGQSPRYVPHAWERHQAVWQSLLGHPFLAPCRGHSPGVSWPGRRRKARQEERSPLETTRASSQGSCCGGHAVQCANGQVKPPRDGEGNQVRIIGRAINCSCERSRALKPRPLGLCELHACLHAMQTIEAGIPESVPRSFPKNWKGVTS